jgi:hypothetical protein
MASSHFFRVGKLKGANGVLEALKHNKRELQAERGALAHIDVTKTSLNYALAGLNDATAIARHAKAQMAYAGIDKPRKNGVMAVEVIFSLPIGRHQQDTKPFFIDCCEWVLKIFTGELLSFDVHLDESAPHAHAIILPLVDGKMQGNAMVGDRGNLYRFISEFHKLVGEKYGLNRRDTARLNQTDRKSIAREVLKHLSADSVLQSMVWGCVRDAISKDPIPYAQMLGLPLAAASKSDTKSFVDIKRGHGKGTFET